MRVASICRGRSDPGRPRGACVVGVLGRTGFKPIRRGDQSSRGASRAVDVSAAVADRALAASLYGWSGECARGFTALRHTACLPVVVRRPEAELLHAVGLPGKAARSTGWADGGS